MAAVKAITEKATKIPAPKKLTGLKVTSATKAKAPKTLSMPKVATPKVPTIKGSGGGLSNYLKASKIVPLKINTKLPQ